VPGELTLLLLRCSRVLTRARQVHAVSQAVTSSAQVFPPWIVGQLRPKNESFAALAEELYQGKKVSRSIDLQVLSTLQPVPGRLDSGLYKRLMARFNTEKATKLAAKARQKKAAKEVEAAKEVAGGADGAAAKSAAPARKKKSAATGN